ncbi:YveK family protein [Alteribacillus sp. HJP-4]|uniref:YveK family protein n=1 Tax=Alteribacillus sp. HJP-4 TaxID=2775394 RepID=UPI0035CCF7FD
MEETISLQEIFQTLRKRLGMIVGITALAVIAAAIISFFILTPTYESETQILVSQQANQQAESLEEAGFSQDQDYIETYNLILTSPYILNQVGDELGMSDMENLRDKITVTQEGESQLVTLTVQDPDPAQAADIANTTASVFEREITELLNVDNVVIIAEGAVEDSPVSPNAMLNMAIAFVVGIMAAVGLAFLLEFLDTTYRSEEDVEKELELPLLGSVPFIDPANTQDVKQADDTSESYSNHEVRGRERIGS